MKQLNLRDSVTFYPVRVDQNGVHYWRTRGNSIAESEKFSLNLRTSPKTQISKVSVKIAIPYWYNVPGKTGVQAQETLRADLELILPPHASEAQRASLLQSVTGALGLTEVGNATKLLEAVF